VILPELAMFIRPSHRLFQVLVAAIGLVCLLALLNTWEKSYSRYKPSILLSSKHGPSVPPPAIVSFWAEWASKFEEAKPNIDPIELQYRASTDGSDEADGERTPSQSILGLSQGDVDNLHAAHKGLLQHIRRSTDSFQNITSTIYSGTGVVIVAGGQYFAPAILTLRMLRRSGSRLPVQVFLQSRTEYEPDICEHVLPALGAECFVLESFLTRKSPLKISHYQLKVLAVLFSSYETAVLLDSDCMPLRDPNELLTAEPFSSSGLVSWPDYWIATEDPVFYMIAGLPDFPKGMPARASESGQLLISKKIHLPTLLLAAYYNIYGPGFYYPILSQGAAGEGDKETFLAAAVVLGLPYYRVKTHVGTVGYHTEDGEFKGGAIVQFHPGDDALASAINDTTHPIRPFFLHANVPKMNLGRLLDDGVLVSEKTKKPLRLWGPKESQEKIFGTDLERDVWDILKSVGCELDRTLKDWIGRSRVCERAQEHWIEVFEPHRRLAGII